MTKSYFDISLLVMISEGSYSSFFLRTIIVLLLFYEIGVIPFCKLIFNRFGTDPLNLLSLIYIPSITIRPSLSASYLSILCLVSFPRNGQHNTVNDFCIKRFKICQLQEIPHAQKMSYTLPGWPKHWNFLQRHLSRLVIKAHEWTTFVSMVLFD